MCSGTELPANLRMLLKSISSDPKDKNLINENSFRNDELDALRSAVTNSQERVHSIPAEKRENLRNSLAVVKKLPAEKKVSLHGVSEPAGAHRESINEMLSPTIQYKDYKLEDLVHKMPLSSATDTNFTMATTIGRAKYEPDENGNLHVIDTYDFNNAEKIKRHSLVEKLNSVLNPLAGGTSFPYRAARIAGAQFGKPMEMDIQIQIQIQIQNGAEGKW